MQRWDITSDAYWNNFCEHRTRLIAEGKKVIVEFMPEHRSLDQNSMIHALYKQIGQQCEDQSITDIKRECKLRFGVPILKANNEKFRDLYVKSIQSHLTYEEKLKAMDILPVTRLMNKAQATEYIDQVIREYSQQGYCLVHPSEAA